MERGLNKGCMSRCASAQHDRALSDRGAEGAEENLWHLQQEWEILSRPPEFVW